MRVPVQKYVLLPHFFFVSLFKRGLHDGFELRASAILVGALGSLG